MISEQPTQSSETPRPRPPSERASDYDLVVIGGAFSGAATALIMKRRLPDLKVLVIERSQVFERKVGEATVELSSFFLCRVLGLFDHLSRQHLPKHGLRYWFSDGNGRALDEMTEVGPWDAPSLPSFQLDRPTLDNHLLDLAREADIQVWRPAKVKTVDIGWPQSILRVEKDGESRSLTTRWLVDASGRQSFLARKLGLQHKLEDHPTAAVWGRWRGAKDLDSPQMSAGLDARQPRMPPVAASRRLATNHFCGYGWWCWVIPLANGNTSIGLVYNKELFDLPAGGSQRERYEAFLRSTDGLRDLLVDAELDGDDFMALRHLPYYSERYMDRGWALVGDAASFIDPYYSPGLDHAATSIFATAQILEDDFKSPGRDPEDLQRQIDFHNKDFGASYRQWFGALYDGKYELFGDAELTRCAFLMDTGLYYAAVVSSLERDIDSLRNPIFGAIPPSIMAFKTTRWFNQRLLKLARFRRQAGIYGRANVGRRHHSKAFSIGLGPAVRPIGTALRIWLRLEAERMFYRLRHGRIQDSAPVAGPATSRA